MKAYFAVPLLWFCIGYLQTASAQDQSAYITYTYGNHLFTSNVSLNEINPRAFRHFEENYPGMKDARWTKNEKGFALSGSVAQKSTTYHVFYDKHGEFLYDLKFYQSPFIDPELKRLLTKFYPGYAVLNATVLKRNDRTTIGANLIRDRHQLVVEINNNEAKVVNEFENNTLNYSSSLFAEFCLAVAL